MNTTLDKQMPPKAFYVLGMNWYCYVEPTETDLALGKEDLLVEVCTKALEAFLGLRHNDTLTVMDKELEPMIGIMFAVTTKGEEDSEQAYLYVPSYQALGNSGRYNDSIHSRKMHDEFMAKVEGALLEKTAPPMESEIIATPPAVPKPQKKPRKKKIPPQE